MKTNLHLTEYHVIVLFHSLIWKALSQFCQSDEFSKTKKEHVPKT